MEIVLKKIVENKLNSINELTIEDCDRLCSLGFKNVTTINNVYLRNKHKDLIAEYKLLYPQHPFITINEIREICIENPMLMFANANKYRYLIPEKNIHDILKFKVKNEHINNLNVYNEPIVDFNYDTPNKFMVLAPKIMFQKDESFDSDPLVFFEVIGGYLLVTGWGDETSLVNNPNIN